MSFDKALEFTLSQEGGTVRDPIGGLTNHGVTQSAYNAFRGDNHLPLASVETIDDAELTAFYLLRYWVPAGCDKLTAHLAQAHFDTAVNMGVEGAIRMLQHVVGVAADGVFGPITLAAIEQHIERDTIARYLDLRVAHYRKLALCGEDQARCLAGWLQRVAALRRAVSEN
jgi:lysozyme family protein